MANFNGFTAHPIERFTSLDEQDDATNLPLGLAAVARNVQYHLISVRTRDGINQTVGNCAVGMNTQKAQPITGLNSFKFSGNGAVPDKQVPLVFDAAGNMFTENPAGSGVLVPVLSAQVTPPPGYLQGTQTLNRGYFAFTDLKNSLALPAALDLNTGILDPASGKLFGSSWAPNTAYQVGETVTPQGAAGNGHVYRCTVAGTSGANQPAFPTGDGQTVVDGTVTRDDLPEIERLWDEQELRFAGTAVKVDRPQLFADAGDSQAFAPCRPPIMRLRVAIEEGKITGFRYVEAVPEVCLVTGSEAVMQSLPRELVEECHYFRNKGFRSGWGLVPVKFAKTLGRFLRTTPLRVWENLRLIGCDFSQLGD